MQNFEPNFNTGHSTGRGTLSVNRGDAPGALQSLFKRASMQVKFVAQTSLLQLGCQPPVHPRANPLARRNSGAPYSAAYISNEARREYEMQF